MKNQVAFLLLYMYISRKHIFLYNKKKTPIIAVFELVQNYYNVKLCHS